MGEGGRPEAMATTNKWRVWRESNGQRYNQPIEGGGVTAVYRTRPNSKFIRDLSSVGHGSRVPPPSYRAPSRMP